MKPLIGLVGRRRTGSMIAGLPAPLDHLDLDLYFADYARGIAAAGGLGVNLPLDSDPAEMVARMDGIVLSGGSDVGTEWYGQPCENDDYPSEPIRDAYEMAVMDAIVERQMPALGICRGLQLANVHGGGTLHQHVPEHARYDLPPSTEVHEARFEPGSVLAGLYGATMQINSLHHQTVNEVAPDYEVTAIGDDGTIEGLEHRSLPIVSVQWHPELMDGRDSDPTFTWLVEQARTYAQQR